MKKMLLFVVGILALVGIVSAAPTPKGMLYLNGDIVGTVVVPANLPHGGTDPLYMFPNGEQMAIAGLGPGEEGYSGGDWAVNLVTWNVAPYDLMSDEDVMAAELAGNITVVRDETADFRCPITKKNKY